VLVGTWTKEFDREKAELVLSGEDPFDERTLVDDHGGGDEDAAPPTESTETAAK
jgi:aerobic C4-dicarboxylate transport protein